MVYSTSPNAVRFRQARERAGLSPEEAAARMGIATAALWDIECVDDELTSAYSPFQIRRFCQVLAITPRELFGIEAEAAPLSASDLARLVHEYCLERGLAIQQLEHLAGWNIAKSLDDPERCFNEEYPVDGIQDLCYELGVDWHRFILSLSTEPPTN